MANVGGKGLLKGENNVVGSTRNNGTYYVRRELDSAHPPGRTIKLLEAGVQTSYVHSSTNDNNGETKAVVKGEIAGKAPR